jgi:8-amino-7-oxononanoate synthase
LKDLQTALQQRRTEHLYRARRISDGPQQPLMQINGRSVISFCSNDYLGLANHPAVKAAFIAGVEKYGAGSGAAHLINGHSRVHHELEQELAAFTGYPRALLFSTGYMANLGVTQALVGRGDTVFEDRLNHASLLDGGRLSGARLMRYAHNDAVALEQKLDAAHSGEKLVMTDGVFSMDGDIANLPALTGICHERDARFMVDDAHGFGVLGDNGRGSPEHFGLRPDDIPIYMATLGKALGTAGAFVAGSEELVETLINTARTYIYTTASPPAIAEATRAALRLIQHEPRIRTKLNDNIQYFRTCAVQVGLPLSASSTAIQPLIIGDTAATVALSERLFESGLLVTAIRPPTVPQDTARLRITLSAAHTQTQIDRLIQQLERLYKLHGGSNPVEPTTE